MTTEEKINDIIEKRYNNYTPKFYRQLKPIHAMIRRMNNDEYFLSFLEKSERENPKPIYTLPKELIK